jgi:hypothetical protein
MPQLANAAVTGPVAQSGGPLGEAGSAPVVHLRGFREVSWWSDMLCNSGQKLCNDGRGRSVAEMAEKGGSLFGGGDWVLVVISGSNCLCGTSM